MQVEAEELPDVSLKYEIAAVPTFVFLKVCVIQCMCVWYPCIYTCIILVTSTQGGKVVDRVNGAHVPELTKKTATHSELMAPPPPSLTTPTEDLNERLRRLTTSAKCLLFMKGTPQEPRCGRW